MREWEACYSSVWDDEKVLETNGGDGCTVGEYD